MTELYRASYVVSEDLFTNKETECFYISISDFIDKFFKIDAKSGRIELGSTLKSKPEFYNGKKVICNSKGVFYK